MGTAARKSIRMPFAVALGLAWVLTGAPATHAVTCASPDELCTGDPCVIGHLKLPGRCVLDFGDRTLVLAGSLMIPNGGELSLSAGDIDVRRAIIGRHAKPFTGVGATITLTARDDITVRWRIDASGRTVPGRITLTAGDDIRLLAPVRASANGPNPMAPGGTIQISAGGTLSAIPRARLRAQGAAATAGGTIALEGRGGVQLATKVAADGRGGGSVSVSSAAGHILLEQALTATGTDGAGGSIVALAMAGSVTMRDRLDVGGVTTGGSAFVVGARGVVSASLRARGGLATGLGGSLLLASDRDITITDALYADGGSGGSIQVVSTNGSLHTLHPLLADGSTGAGGAIAISVAGQARIDATLDADGRRAGGSISIGGATVRVGNRGTLAARGDVGGRIAVSGGSVTVDPGAKVLVDGDAPSGTIAFDATAGDLALLGDFRARGEGGQIRGSAAGGLIASGMFTARGNGCIAFTGATVDISGGAFDTPPSASCP